MGVTVDLYYTKPTVAGIGRFFKKHFPEADEFLALYSKHHQTTSWWESDHFQAFLADRKRVREIIDDYLDRKTITPVNLAWVNGISATLKTMVALEKSISPDTTEIDLSENRAYVSYLSDPIHALPLYAVYGLIQAALTRMLIGEARSIKRCVFCGKVIDAWEYRGPERRFCNARCRKQHFDSERKKA